MPQTHNRQGMTKDQLKKVFKSGRTFYRVGCGRIEVVQLQGKKIHMLDTDYIIGVDGYRERFQGWDGSIQKHWKSGTNSYFLDDLQGHDGSHEGFACFDTIRKAERFLAASKRNPFHYRAENYNYYQDSRLIWKD